MTACRYKRNIFIFVGIVITLTFLNQGVAQENSGSLLKESCEVFNKKPKGTMLEYGDSMHCVGYVSGLIEGLTHADRAKFSYLNCLTNNKENIKADAAAVGVTISRYNRNYPNKNHATAELLLRHAIQDTWCGK